MSQKSASPALSYGDTPAARGGKEGGGSEGKLRKNCQGVLLLTWVVRSHYNKEREKERSTSFLSRIHGIIVNIILGLYGRS